jgi:hypothetical protein
MLQVASTMPATKSKKVVRALGAMERLFWLMAQKHPARHAAFIWSEVWFLFSLVIQALFGNVTTILRES